VIDEYPDEEIPAGSPLHVAAHLSSRGWTVHLVTRVGRDAGGRSIKAVLDSYGVRADLVETDPALATGRVTVESRGLENRFLIQRPSAWDSIAGPALLPRHHVFCYGTLVARSERSRRTLNRLLSSSRAPIKMLDVNLRPPDVAPDIVREALQAATAVKAGEAELVDAAEILGIAPEPCAYFGLAPSLRWLCVTRGEKGAVLYNRSGKSWTAPATYVDVVDTVGAGDAFTAGLIEGLAGGSGGDAALRLGLDRAASVLSTRGGLPAPDLR
jgi:fructokinase